LAKHNHIENKLDAISRLEEGELIVDYGVTLDSPMVAYVQFVLMLIELQEMSS